MQRKDHVSPFSAHADHWFQYIQVPPRPIPILSLFTSPFFFIITQIIYNHILTFRATDIVIIYGLNMPHILHNMALYFFHFWGVLGGGVTPYPLYGSWLQWPKGSPDYFIKSLIRLLSFHEDSPGPYIISCLIIVNALLFITTTCV